MPILEQSNIASIPQFKTSFVSGLNVLNPTQHLSLDLVVYRMVVDNQPFPGSMSHLSVFDEVNATVVPMEDFLPKDTPRFILGFPGREVQVFMDYVAELNQAWFVEKLYRHSFQTLG